MFNRIYRGSVLIVNGKAEVDIDKAYALKQYENIVPFAEKIKNAQLILQNNQSYDSVKGYIEGGKIKLFCDNYSHEIEVDWLVIADDI